MLISFDQLEDLNKRRFDEARKLEEITVEEEKAKELAIEEKEKHEAAEMEAQRLRQCTEREAALKREAETKAMRDAKEKEKLESALVGPVQQYQNFTWEEIISATSSFSEDLKIGMGGYGNIYKGNFHHTTAAVKVLHSNESHKINQFQQEVQQFVIHLNNCSYIFKFFFKIREVSLSGKSSLEYKKYPTGRKQFVNVKSSSRSVKLSYFSQLDMILK